MITDNTYDGVVIKLGKILIIFLLGEDVIAGSAVLDKVYPICYAKKFKWIWISILYSRYCWWWIRMNAGYFGYEIKDRLLSIQVVDVFGNVKTIPSNNIRFNYRGNDLPDDLIFLSASFRV